MNAITRAAAATRVIHVREPLLAIAAELERRREPFVLATVVRCEAPTSIEFFQPKPPPFLLEHSGGWRFEELADGTCAVTTYHRWKTNPAGAEKAYGGTVEEQEGKIHQQLLEHAEFALQCWKTALESGAVQRGRGREVESEHQSAPKSRDRHALVSL